MRICLFAICMSLTRAANTLLLLFLSLFRVLEDLGGKTHIIRLIDSEDLDVRSNALLALQKIMVQNW